MFLVAVVAGLVERTVGQLVLLVGLMDGRIMIRSCATMALFFVIEASVANTRTVWGFVDMGDEAHFASAGDDGSLIVWNVGVPLMETS